MYKAFRILRQGNPVAKILFISLLLAVMVAVGVSRVYALPNILFFWSNLFTITVSAPGADQMTPASAYSKNLDQWLVVWKDFRTAGRASLYARRVDKSANVLNPEITVLNNGNNLDMPAAAFDANQLRYLVVWENNTNGNIGGKILNSTGTNFTDAFPIADCADCGYPDVVYSPLDDKYLVVWEETLSLNDKNIYGRFVGVDGALDPGGAFPIATIVNLIEQKPAVVVDPDDGRYVVVYSRESPTGDQIYGQRLLGTGLKSGTALPITSLSGDETYPRVAYNPAENAAFVAWNREVNASTTEVEGCLLRNNNTLSDVLTLSTPAGTEENNVSLAYASKGNLFVAAWDNGQDIIARAVTVGGAVASDPLTVTAANKQYGAQLVFGGDRFLVVFNDWSEQYDIVGRFLAANPPLYLPVVIK